jgi:hypothetical protein
METKLSLLWCPIAWACPVSNSNNNMLTCSENALFWEHNCLPSSHATLLCSLLQPLWTSKYRRTDRRGSRLHRIALGIGYMVNHHRLHCSYLPQYTVCMQECNTVCCCEEFVYVNPHLRPGILTYSPAHDGACISCLTNLLFARHCFQDKYALAIVLIIYAFVFHFNGSAQRLLARSLTAFPLSAARTCTRNISKSDYNAIAATTLKCDSTRLRRIDFYGCSTLRNNVAKYDGKQSCSRKSTYSLHVNMLLLPQEIRQAHASGLCNKESWEKPQTTAVFVSFWTFLASAARRWEREREREAAVAAAYFLKRDWWKMPEKESKKASDPTSRVHANGWAIGMNLH